MVVSGEHAVAGLPPGETGFTARRGGGRGGHPLGAVGEGKLLGFFLLIVIRFGIVLVTK